MNKIFLLTVEFGDVAPYLLILLIFFVLYVAIIRWVFRINEILSNQKEILAALTKILEKINPDSKIEKTHTSTEKNLESKPARLERLKWRHNLGEITQKQYDEEKQKILEKE